MSTIDGEICKRARVNDDQDDTNDGYVKNTIPRSSLSVFRSVVLQDLDRSSHVPNFETCPEWIRGMLSSYFQASDEYDLTIVCRKNCFIKEAGIES